MHDDTPNAPIDRNDHLPLYVQIAQIVEERITSGKYATRQAIPPEVQLAKDFSVGRPTMRQALDLLVRRKMLERRRGSGTYVLPPPPSVDIFSLGGTLTCFEDGPVDTKASLLGQPRNLVRGTLDTGEAIEIRRLTRDIETPLLLEIIEFDAKVFPGLSSHVKDGVSLSELTRRHYGLELESAKQDFSVCAASNDVADLLELEHETPILTVERTLTFEQAGPAVFAAMFLRTTETMHFSQVIHP